MSFFKASVRKLSELSWADLRNLFTWPSDSTIQADNPNLLIAKAANERGEVVAYVMAEPIVLVDSYVLNPQNSKEDDQNASDAIEHALAEQAGVNRMWFVIPDNAPIMGGEKFVRVLERKVCQPVTNTQYSARLSSQPSVAFLN